MSDRQVLAEFGSGLCVAGFGLAAVGTTLAPFVVPAAVLSAWVMDFRGRCDKRLAEKAVAAALTALKDAPGLSTTDLTAARRYLASRTKGQLRLDPAVMARAAKSGDLGDVLYTLVTDDTMPRDGAVGPILRMVLEATYQACRHDEAYHRILTQDILIDLCRSHGITVETLARIEAKVDLLVDQLSRTTEDLGLKKGMVIGIAKVFATDVDDFDTALRELTRAVGIAARIERQGSLPSNTGDQISAVMAEVARLNRAQEFTAAAQVIDAAFDQIEAQRARLIEAGLEQAILRRNAADAAKWAIHQVKLTAQGATLFDALLAEQDRWYVTGRDKGLAFDLQVSIALAQALQEHAATPDQRGSALNNLGNALSILGERDPGTARLEGSVTAYRAALEEYTRDRVPLDWAVTQNNLGTTLYTLGEREPGTARLEEAVTAYRAALEERTRDRVPLNWAMTQNNLGAALFTLGERQPGTARLEEAVTAYRAALEERTRDRVPLDWAMTQNNLGNALIAVGESELGTARLEEAITAYRAALEEYTRDRVPLNWAMTQNNLGNALRALGEHEPGTARLREAVAAYRAALEERTRDRVPLDWAMSRGNMAVAMGVLADRTSDLAMARNALQQIVEAEAQMRAGGHVPYADYYSAQIPIVQAVIDRLS